MKNYRLIAKTLYILAIPLFISVLYMLHSTNISKPTVFAVFVLGVLVFNLADYFRKRDHNL